MIENNNSRVMRFAFLVNLLIWWNTGVIDVYAAAISKEAENRAIAATVRIYVKQYSWQDYTFSGSGFFVKPHLIVTNFHVIEYEDTQAAWSYIAYSHTGSLRPNPVNRVKVFDVKQDLAVLEVARSNVKPLELGRSETVERLNKVYVVGYPLGLECGITSGEINNPKQMYKEIEYIRFDAAVSPGNSGGPVLDSQGNVVGIATRGSWLIAQNINFAIPSNQLWLLLYRDGIRLKRKSKSDPQNGGSKRRDEEKAIAETERAKAEAKKAEAEAEKAKAEKVKAEAEKVAAEARKVEAEARKAEAEARRVEAERTEGESAKKSKTEVVETKARITNRLQAATVLIYGSDRNGNEGALGSGFFVSQDQVATDFHVIDGSRLQGVKPVGRSTQSADEFIKAKLLKTKRARHLAILQVEKTDVQPLPLGNNESVDIGEEIYMVGDPTSGEYSQGKISKILDEGGVRYFEFDAPVSPGSSGGPIVNAKGEVIGVTALKVVAITGTLKNAIPSDYLTELLDGEGDPPTQSPEPPVTRQESEDDAETTPSTQYDPERLLDRAIKLYEKARYNDAIKNIESVMFRINDSETRALVHLYIGFSKWGLEDTENSVRSDFREALRYDPDIELPPTRIGKDHPIFGPLLEKVRQESTGTVTITTSPPETQIQLYGGAVQPKLPDDRTMPIRLFKGNYAVEGKLGDTAKVVQVQIEPGRHKERHLQMPQMPPIVFPIHEFELTMDIFSTEKPKKVIVHYTRYDASGNQLGPEEKKEMQLQEHEPESSIWVYHVKLPSADQGGRIVYRIEADGKVIRDEPIQVHILEPPINASFGVEDKIPVKARVVSAVTVNEVRVYYDAPRKLSKNSPSKLLKRESESNTYTGEIPAGRSHADTWLFVAAVPEKGIQSRSPTRAVRAKTHRPDEITITLLEPLAPVATDKPINVKAEVKSSAPLNEVRVYYDFPRSKLSKESPYKMLKHSSSDTYTGEIPREYNREKDYIWYFFAAITTIGTETESEDRMIEVKKPTTRMYQGVWTSHSWSSLISDDGFYSGWERGNVMSLAYLQEGKGSQTLGVQLDYTYENPDYISAMAQWGPSTRENPVAFAFLAGATGHRKSDPSFSGVRQSRQFTPLLGGSVKLYPHNRVVVDATASVKLQSENGAADRESSFTEDFLHHYEAGLRLYISPTLNLRAGYGRWRLGEYDNASVQVGLGATF